MHLKEGTLLKGGTYRIRRFIASGGFGCTYEAEHLMLDKRVAVKEFFPKTFCNRDADTSKVTVGTQSQEPLVVKLRAKFVDEARSIAKFSHPGIVKVTDVFEENGTAYYVMDYIEGKSLGDIVDERGPLSEKESVGYIRQVCDALSYVHDKNRLHLDIKPGNIMINEDGRAVLIDFGASKQYDEENGENTSTLIGKTPGFAPIEQMGNDVSRFKPATDVYSVGATLYKCLSGKTPIESNLLADGDELDELPSNISASTKKAIKAAMEVSSKKRPQSIREFVQILDSKDQTEGQNEDRRKSEETIIDVPKSSVSSNPKEHLERASQEPKKSNSSSEVKTNPSQEETIYTKTTVDPTLLPKEERKQLKLRTLNAKEERRSTQEETIIPYAKRKTSKTKVYIVIAAVAIVVLLFCLFAFRGSKEELQTSSITLEQEVETPIVDTAKPLFGEINGHQWVDLGLPSGTKWATCNIGAESPEEYGDYFSWGSTMPKSTYQEDNCITRSMNIQELRSEDIIGDDGSLTPEYDAATRNWGEPWRMPTLEDIDELVKNTTWEVTTQNGIPGRRIKSNLYDTSIFLPAAGYYDVAALNFEGERGYYWSSTPSEINSGGAYYLFFYPDSYNSGWLNRYAGRPVRAVTQ